MSSTKDPIQNTKLMPALVIFAASVVAAIVFAAAFQSPPPLAIDPTLCGVTGEAITAPRTTAKDDDHEHEQTEQTAPRPSDVNKTDENETDGAPVYFGGGLWSDANNLALLSEFAVALYPSDGRVVAQSVRWIDGKLAVLDVSPIGTDKADAATPGLAILSVDHRGADPAAEFATAVQKHLETLTEAKKIVVISPLPGPTKRDEFDFPYDWTFLMIADNVDVVDWAEVEPAADVPGYPGSGYLKAWLAAADVDTDKVEALASDDLVQALWTGGETMTSDHAKWALVSRSPYEVVPALGSYRDLDNQAAEQRYRLLKLQVARALGISPDSVLPEAMNSSIAIERALAARVIGEMPDQVADPMGKLTLLAEDKDMDVRREAYLACLAIGGRQAAGIAQLVQAYEMSDAFAATYASLSPIFARFGEPIPPDSRVNRLRRLPMAELLQEERDAVVSKVLLEREDLSDNLVPVIVKAYADATKQSETLALIQALVEMKPSLAERREVLLQRLATGSLTGDDPQRLLETLREAIGQAKGKNLKAALAAVVLRLAKMPDPGDKPGPLAFSALRYLDDQSLKDQLTKDAVQMATDEQAPLVTRIAALDALVNAQPQTFADDISRIAQLARSAENVELRFAALRTINALPDALKPEDADALQLIQLTIRAVPNELRYDLATLTVTAGRAVELTLVNPDTMPHNLVITRPGQAQSIGMRVSAMSPTAAADIGYVPDSAEVLHATIMVPAGGSDTLRFVAPAQPGQYDYVCTFPGHYSSMLGKLQVVAP